MERDGSPRLTTSQERIARETAVTRSLRFARRVVLLVVGLTIVVIGVILMPLPGPGLLIVLGGLALLALEFAWARIWMQRIRDSASDVTEAVQGPEGRQLRKRAWASLRGLFRAAARLPRRALEKWHVLKERRRRRRPMLSRRVGNAFKVVWRAILNVYALVRQVLRRLRGRGVNRAASRP